MTVSAITYDVVFRHERHVRVMSYAGEVREFVLTNFLFGDGAGLKDDASFLDTGVVDSTGILELIMFVEQKYGIKVETDEMVPENLDSIEKVAGYVERKVGGRSLMAQGAQS